VGISAPSTVTQEKLMLPLTLGQFLLSCPQPFASESRLHAVREKSPSYKGLIFSASNGFRLE
jgi:hypothetical protein